MTPQHLALMFGVNFVWALTLVSAKIGVDEMPPFLFTGLRFLVVAAVLLPFLKIHRGRMWTIFGIAMTAGGIQFGIFFTGLRVAEDVSAVALASQLGVPFAALLSIVFLKEEVRWRRWLGIVLAFTGVMVISFDPRVLSYAAGFALGILGAFVGAISSILMRRLKDVGVYDLQSWIAMFSWPFLIGMSFAFEGNPLPSIQSASAVVWAAMLFAAFCSSLIAHAGMYFLLQRYEVTIVSPLTLLTPIFTIIMGVAFLGDVLTTRMLIGGLITLAGVAIVTMRQPEYVVAEK